MIGNIYASVCGMVGLVFFTTNLIGCINVSGNISRAIFMCCMIVLFLTLLILCLKKIIVLTTDYKDLKNKQFVSLTGKVVGFKANKEPESSVQINDTPIVLDLITHQIITLHVNERLCIGEIYSFKYLKNSKIAEVFLNET